MCNITVSVSDKTHIQVHIDRPLSPPPGHFVINSGIFLRWTSP